MKPFARIASMADSGAGILLTVAVWTFYRLKGDCHRSRGQRPRVQSHDEFRPVRANQITPLSDVYATVIAHPERAHHFFDQRTTTLAYTADSRTSLGLSIPCPAKSGVSFHHRGRFRGSRSCFVQSEQEIPHHEDFGSAEKRFIQVRKIPGFDALRFSLAGWIRPFQRKPIAFRSGSAIYSESRGASSDGDVPGRVSADFEKIWRVFRRAIFVGLKGILECPCRAKGNRRATSEGVALGYDGNRLSGGKCKSLQSFSCARKFSVFSPHEFTQIKV